MPSINTEDTSVVRPSAPPAPAWTPTPDELQAWADTMSRREKNRRLVRLLVTGLATAAAVLVVVLLTLVLGPTLFNAAPQHVPSSIPGPTVPTVTGSRSDTIAPSSPTGLQLTSRSTSSITIIWEAATDNMRVAGYIVTRDGVQVGTTYVPSFTDSGLRAATTYRYRVTAFDDTGNISEPSSAVAASTLGLDQADTMAPTPPGNLTVTGQSTTTITLAWSAATDNIGVAGYDVFRDGQYIATVWRPGYTDTGLSPSTSYTYRVTAFDATYNTSTFSRAVTGTTDAASEPPHATSDQQPTTAPTPTQPPTTTTTEAGQTEPKPTGTQPTPTATQPTPTGTQPTTTETEPSPTETETEPAPTDTETQPPDPLAGNEPVGDTDPADPPPDPVFDDQTGGAAGSGQGTGGTTEDPGEPAPMSEEAASNPAAGPASVSEPDTGEDTPAPSDQDTPPMTVPVATQTAATSGRRRTR